MFRKTQKLNNRLCKVRSLLCISVRFLHVTHVMYVLAEVWCSDFYYNIFFFTGNVSGLRGWKRTRTQCRRLKGFYLE